MRNIVVFVILVLSFLSARAPVAAQEAAPAEQKYEGVVRRMVEERQIEVAPGTMQSQQQVEVELTSGPQKGTRIKAEQGTMMPGNENQTLKTGDRVIVSRLVTTDGSEAYFIVDVIRRGPLLILAIAFLSGVVIVGGWRGLASFAGLVISFVVLFSYIVPQILVGKNPIVTAVAGSFVILITTLYLAHGFSQKTTAAVIGTAMSLIFTSILAFLSVNFTKLSGLGSEEAGFLTMFPAITLNLKGILLAGIIIGTLGVLDDITISQSACIFELHDTDKTLSFGELYRKGLRIGRDHIASLVNTLVLAYAGASLPLLLLFFISGGEPLSILVNREMIATEIVRTLVGSLGLVSAVPITTAIAASMANKDAYKRR